jgi:hypothetical protein
MNGEVKQVYVLGNYLQDLTPVDVCLFFPSDAPHAGMHPSMGGPSGHQQPGFMPNPGASYQPGGMVPVNATGGLPQPMQPPQTSGMIPSSALQGSGVQMPGGLASFVKSCFSLAVRMRCLFADTLRSTMHVQGWVWVQGQEGCQWASLVGCSSSSKALAGLFHHCQPTVLEALRDRGEQVSFCKCK